MCIRILALIFIITTGLGFVTMQKKQRIIFFGDSITQAGVNEGGYITRLEEKFKKEGINNNYELTGAGIGGNKIYDLYLRHEKDVLEKNPDIVVIWVGVNDVWHKRTHMTGTDYDKFELFYRALIQKFLNKNIQVVVCTPAAIGEKTDHTNELDGDLNRYAELIRTIAKSMNVSLIDTRKEFLNYNLKNNPTNLSKGILTTDGVHLNDKGNQLVSELFYNHFIANK